MQRILGLLTMLAAMGCESHLQLSLTISDPCNQSILAEAQSLDFTLASVSGAGEVQASWSVGLGGGEIPSAPLMSDGVASLIARDSVGDAIAGATVGVLDLSGADGTVAPPLRMILGKVNSFSNTTDASDSRNCTTMKGARRDHTATDLGDGRVLIAGGGTLVGGAPAVLDTTEIFDSRTGEFAYGPTMNAARQGHTATRLNDGRILIIGGSSGAEPASGTIDPAGQYALVFDPATSSFTDSVLLQARRAHHTATLLGNGTVMVTGGLSGDTALNSTEIIDPTTMSSSVGPSLAGGRAYHAALLVEDATVAIVGGHNGTEVLGTLEFVSTVAATSVAAQLQLETPRTHAAVALIPNQDTLVVAGGFATLVSAPEAGTGLDSIEVIDLNSGTSTGPALLCESGTLVLDEGRGAATMSMLDNAILIAGGVDGLGQITRSAELLSFSSVLACERASRTTIGGLGTARAGAVAAPLLGGDLLFSGGVSFAFGNAEFVDQGEIFTVSR